MTALKNMNSTDIKIQYLLNLFPLLSSFKRFNKTVWRLNIFWHLNRGRLIKAKGTATKH